MHRRQASEAVLDLCEAGRQVTVLAIDPGYEQSAYVLYDGSRVTKHGIVPNADLMLWMMLQSGESTCQAVVFESVESYGMAVGREVFETVFWTGRMFQVAQGIGEKVTVERMPRKAVKLHLCGSARATDANIRVALVDRFGGTEKAIGKKANQGVLYGIRKHEWAALAVAVTWWDNNRSAVQPMPRVEAV